MNERRKKMESTRCSTVCVTGGAGYIGSLLVKKLLQNGHTVHATLRNLNDESKVELLKSLPNASSNLALFKADIYDPIEFQKPIQGCEFVFHVATPLQHTDGSQYKNTTEASVAAAKMIARFCVESGTVKRLIYTASVLSASPMKEDGSGFKDIMDESCWTPLNLSYSYCIQRLKEYIESKTETEKELLKFGESEEANGLEVVTLPCGLVAGDTLLSFAGESNILFISQFTDYAEAFTALKCIEELNGKVPLVHVQDVSDSHIFCIQQSSISGRFLCANCYFSTSEIASYYHSHHPELQQKQGGSNDVAEKNIRWKSNKLIEKGFKFKYNSDIILEDALECCKKAIPQFYSNSS